MPSAIPDDAATRLPKARMIDPRGHRFGAGVSAVLLIAAFLTGTTWLVAVVLASIGISAAFGLRYSIYGVVWRRLAKALALPKVEPEHEYPPRFAQVLGSTALILALLAFALGATTIGWGLTLAVAGLQSVLAVDRLLPRLPPVLPALVGARPRHPHLDARPGAPRHEHARAGADQLPLIAAASARMSGPGIRPGREHLALRHRTARRRATRSGSDDARRSPRPRSSR